MEKRSAFEIAHEEAEKGNLKGAFELFLSAAKDGDVASMERVACMYYDGHGVERDFLKSIEWDKKAIDLGSHISLSNLAITYRTMGDIKKAKYWFEKAIAEGDGDSALDLAKLYMVSDLESANVKKYLLLAKNSRNVVGSYRSEAERLLNEIDN